MIPNDTYDNSAIEVHHKRGRVGTLLTDKRYFLAVCTICHRYLEDHPEFAVSNGWSLSRLKKDENAKPEISDESGDGNGGVSGDSGNVSGGESLLGNNHGAEMGGLGENQRSVEGEGESVV